MTTPDINPAKLTAYMRELQQTATTLSALIEGIDILLEEKRGRNAAQALIGIAQEIADKIASDVDSISWPKAVAEDIDALARGVQA
ncbi:hypothetical protein GC209_14360 [bacterium]|nr:hypothetical protein [bacterium]